MFKTKVRSYFSRLNPLLITLLCLVLVGITPILVSGCNAPSGGANSQNSGDTLAPGSVDPNGTSTSGTNDPNHITIAVKYVALEPDANTAPYPTQAQVVALLGRMSTIWSQCDIGFQLETYLSPVAANYNVAYNPANQYQLEDMRTAFDDRKTALFVKTGTWDRTGDLGNDGSNGFSTLPPSDPEGAVFEQSVAESALLLSHESGHLMGGLAHTTDPTNLMNHFVTSSTTILTQAQCAQTRAEIAQYHSAWER